MASPETTTTVKKVNIKKLAKFLLFSVLFVYLTCILISQQFKFVRLEEEHASVDRKIESAQKEQKNLNSELESIDSEDYLRRVIREKLGFTKPNEKVFVDANK